MVDFTKLVVSDLLCYAINKLGRAAVRPLKGNILDFYDNSDITVAKDILIEHYERVMDKTIKVPRRRKESVGRANTELDDIFTILHHIDERKMIEKLPVFVSTDPDKMPSIKLSDGDLGAVMLKLSKIEDDIVAVKKSVADNARTTISKPPKAPFQTMQATSSVIPIRPEAVPSVMIAEISSDESANGDDTSDVPWQEVKPRVKKQASRKRMRQATSPPLNSMDNRPSYASMSKKESAVLQPSQSSSKKATLKGPTKIMQNYNRKGVIGARIIVHSEPRKH